MKIDLTQFRRTFLQESADHIATMESGLLQLRSSPDDSEILNAVFRSAHSIKGGAGSFGLDHLAHFTHGLENLLDQLRSLAVPVTEGVIATMLESIDVLRVMIEAGADDVLPPGTEELSLRIAALAHVPEQAADAGDVDPEAGHEAQPEQDDDPLVLYEVNFKPDREMFASGTNPVVLLRNLAALGDVSVTHLHTDDLPSLAELDPEQCYLGWTIEIATSRSEEKLREVFEFVEHLAEISIRRVDAEPRRTPADVAVPLPSAESTPAADAPSGASAASVSHAVAGDGSSGAVHRVPTKSGESSSIRVATEKVDRLIDLVGELVIAHVMTAQMVEGFTPHCLPRLRESVMAMERNTRELHERVMSIRMLPVGTLFQRYARIVYDIAHTTGKQITLATSGEETEVDKSMLEMLGDPLTHLIRNAADHGIEAPDVRLAAGKPAEGTIGLRAFHRSGRVVIEVSDDGAGIDAEKVRAKAVERGLIAADAQLTEEQVRMLIFEPGFSTRDQVTDLSGRGVGMDVVRQNVQQLNGTIALTSERGRGSTVSIELPLTLAIVEGLLVRVADRTLVLPLLSVVETVCPQRGQIQRIAEKGDVVVIRDETIPLLRLRRFLGLAPESEEQRSAGRRSGARNLTVVVAAGRKKIGLVVDELLGQQQVVVKSLERHLRKVDGLMGATILGDGCVAPIVDVACLAGMNLFSLEDADSSGGQTVVRGTANNEFRSEESGEQVHAMV